MTAMTDPLAGTRRHRAEAARAAIGAYEAWIADDDLAAPPPYWAFGSLVTCARWLLETLEGGPAVPAGPRVTALANTAVKHLDTGQMREVLNVLALRVPGTVIAAIEEAGA